MPNPTRVRPLLILSALLMAAFVTVSASAQGANVLVEVRAAEGEGPGAATVTLTPRGGGSPVSCTTTNGRCRIEGVAAGMYVASAEPTAGGEAPISRPLPIPAGGDVRVVVRLR